MNLIKAPIYEELRKYLSYATIEQNIFLYVPYIQTEILKELVYNINNQVIIVTTWKPLDLLLGSSELSLYNFCKEHKFTLYVNNSLHLKVYSRGLEDIFLATANISRHGLGLVPKYNLECGIFIANLRNEDRLYFNKILNESTLINDRIYGTMVEWLEKYRGKLPKFENFDQIVPSIQKEQFLISALPMTRDVETLEKCYLRVNNGYIASEDREIRNCFFHDLANYKIDLGLPIMNFRLQLANSFFSNPFIRKIDEIINPETYFGRIKEWIQMNCKDVPVPSRRELTGNVQVLLKWFETLGSGKYIIDIPGSHSQRIRKLI